MFAAAASAADPAAWRVWLEPRFVRSAATAPIVDAERTAWVAGVRVGGELRPFSRAEWEAIGLGWEGFLPRARENAAADLAALEPRLERDRRQVILYAVLHSPEPIVVAALAAPSFVERWASTFGPDLLVAIPNAFTAYVFPKLASNPQAIVETIFDQYRATAHPVSTELFEVNADGWRAIGRFEEP